MPPVLSWLTAGYSSPAVPLTVASGVSNLSVAASKRW